MSLPEQEFNIFLSTIANGGKICKINVYGTYSCECESNDEAGWPVIHFNIGPNFASNWVYLKGEDYLMYNDFYKRCSLRITPGYAFEETWLIGVPFLQAYYIIHDMDK